MRRSGRPRYRCVLGALAALASIAPGCIAMDSPLIEESAAGCAELASAELVASAPVDIEVRDLMLAAITLRASAAELRARVFEACRDVAAALGAGDTWSSLRTAEEAVSNLAGTGACDRASAELARRALGSVAVETSPGECRLDVAAHADCQRGCQARELCLEACNTRTQSRPICVPPGVEISAELRQRPELAPLVDALARGLPVLLEAELRRDLITSATEQLGTTAANTAEVRAEQLDGKSVACAGEASTALVSSVASVELCWTGAERVLLASGIWTTR